jgi:hypothetical protein
MSDLGPLRIWEEPAIRLAPSWYLEVAENQRPAKFRIAATLATALAPGASTEDALWAELDRLTPIFVARWQAIRAGAAARRRGRADASNSGPLTRYRIRAGAAARRRGRADASNSGPLTRYRARGSFGDRLIAVAWPARRSEPTSQTSRSYIARLSLIVSSLWLARNCHSAIGE